MADDGVVVARVPFSSCMATSQKHVSSLDQRPETSCWSNRRSFLSDDTECAQALLLLAAAAVNDTTISNPTPEPRVNRPIPPTETRMVTRRHNTLPDVSHAPEPEASNESILKRELEDSSATDAQTEHSPAAASSSPESSKEEKLRWELVKRIRLDHNYVWCGDEKYYLLNPKYAGGSENNHHGGKKSRTDNSGSSKLTKYVIVKKDKLNAENGTKTTKKRTSGEHYKRSPVKSQVRASGASPKPSTCKTTIVKADPFEFCDEEVEVNALQKFKVKRSKMMTPVEKRHHYVTSLAQVEPPLMEDPSNPSSSDLYEPSDSKFKNFNLLLKCLTSEQPGGAEATTENDWLGDGPECQPDESQNSKATDAIEYKCHCCQRLFACKRYLAKHIRRMHPDTDLAKALADVMATCTNCGQQVSRRILKRHTHFCSGVEPKKIKKQYETDLANCQLCGVRMKRHLLVKHLAREHCVENGKDGEMAVLQGESDSDSDSSTVSASDYDDDGGPSRDWSVADDTGKVHSGRKIQVTCQLCGLKLRRVQLVKHMEEEHCIDRNREEGSVGVVSKSNCNHSMLQRYLNEDEELETALSLSAECNSCLETLRNRQVEPPVSPDVHVEESLLVTSDAATVPQSVANMPVADASDIPKTIGSKKMELCTFIN